MTHLVNDLLDISRITSGRIRLQQETVEPGDLLESVIETQRQSAATARRREASRASAPQRHGHSSAICRVLIADDTHDAAESLSMLLQAMGHDTRVVHDGIEALEEAELFRPDIALLDIGMPNLDGYETARRMRSRPWAAAVRIVRVTGWGQETDQQRAKDAGFHLHLVKPVNLDALKEVMFEACEEPREQPSR